MNYQPFLDANLLVSDPLLAEFHRLKPDLIILAILTFYALFALHMVIYCTYKMVRQPKRNYPAHEKRRCLMLDFIVVFSTIFFMMSLAAYGVATLFKGF